MGATTAKCEACGAAIDPDDALCRSCGRIRNVQRRSMLPIVIGIVFLAFIGVTFFFGFRTYATAAKFQPRNDLISIHPIAEKWVADHEGQCPTVAQLRDERELSASSKIDDPWGSPYRITCNGNAVTMHCDGPDRRANTPDDLTYP